MKLITTLFLAALLMAPGVAGAQTIDFRTATCKDFVALPEDALDVVAAWIDGHLSDEEDPESMVVDASATDADEIKAHCKQHMGTKLLEAVETME